jgi:hypothetical protein
MPGMRDFLERLRPTGTPGTAALAGVPADRVAELAAELQPVLDRVADAEREATGIRDRAHHEAARRRDEGVARARAVVEEARRGADAERRSEAATARTRAAQEAADLMAQAADEAARIDAAAGRAREALAAQVRELARAELTEVVGGAP